MLLGDGESWARQRVDFAGLPEMVRTFLQVAAGAADIPVTRLLGQSPAGLSATGDSDTRNYYDMIAARQELDLRPQLERLDRLNLRSEGIDAGDLTLHPSRVLRFLGNPLPDPSLTGTVWSDSVLQVLSDAIRAVALTTAGATSLPPGIDLPSFPFDEALMPYTVPVPADLAARFPAFAAVPPATLARAIAEAQTRVDTRWLPSDYAIAILLLAAHTLTLDGLGTGAEAASAAAGTLGYASLRSGGLSLDRQRSPRGAAEPSLLAETTYGRRFLALLKVNQPAVFVP